MRFLINVVSLLLLTLSACSTGPSQEQLNRIALQESHKIKNTDLLVELFTTGFWNRSLNDVFENDGIVLSQNKNFFYDDGVRKCPSIRVGNDQYGKSQPYFSIDQNGYSPGVNGSNASTGVIGKFGFKQSCSTSPLMMLRHKNPLALYVEDASIIKNKLIAAGEVTPKKRTI